MINDIVINTLSNIVVDIITPSEEYIPPNTLVSVVFGGEAVTFGGEAVTFGGEIE